MSSSITHHIFSTEELESETQRLWQKLDMVGFNQGYCKIIAPLTLEIERLKKEKNAIILAHSYQTPDIMYGVADFIGDSYQLSQKAAKTDADIIVFSGVRFMAETAKILNPKKQVIIPAPNAGCSLADAIKAEDVRELKKHYPSVPVVVYVNTSAEVKAEADICCTSSNALQIIESIPDNTIIFLPDEFMGANLQKQTSKKLITWNGRCIVHEDFDAIKVNYFRQQNPGLKILAHSECSPQVAHVSDLVGGTSAMIHYVNNTDALAYMLVTECGLSERMKIEFPQKNFVGMCSLCPYMKMNTLPLIKQVLLEPKEGQIIEVPEHIRLKALRSLEKMFQIAQRKTLTCSSFN